MQLLTINLLIEDHMTRIPPIKLWLFGLGMVIAAEPEGDVLSSEAEEIQYIVHELLIVHDTVVVQMNSN